MQQTPPSQDGLADKHGTTSGMAYAFGAGVWGALASVWGKLATMNYNGQGGGGLCPLISQWIPFWSNMWDNYCIELGPWLEYIVRGVLFGLVILSNVLMWNLFVKSMHASSSIVGTVASSASNFFLSALVGFILFGEYLPLTWWAGATCILLGLYLISRGEAPKEQKKEDKKTQ
jgi:drug/metabolite transporter (DMT)-like permease